MLLLCPPNVAASVLDDFQRLHLALVLAGLCPLLTPAHKRGRVVLYHTALLTCWYNCKGGALLTSEEW